MLIYEIHRCAATQCGGYCNTQTRGGALMLFVDALCTVHNAVRAVRTATCWSTTTYGYFIWQVLSRFRSGRSYCRTVSPNRRFERLHTRCLFSAEVIRKSLKALLVSFAEVTRPEPSCQGSIAVIDILALTACRFNTATTGRPSSGQRPRHLLILIFVLHNSYIDKTKIWTIPSRQCRWGVASDHRLSASPNQATPPPTLTMALQADEALLRRCCTICHRSRHEKWSMAVRPTDIASLAFSRPLRLQTT